jgi:hypothetical protein
MKAHGDPINRCKRAHAMHLAQADLSSQGNLFNVTFST